MPAETMKARVETIIYYSPAKLSMLLIVNLLLVFCVVMLAISMDLPMFAIVAIGIVLSLMVYLLIQATLRLAVYEINEHGINENIRPKHKKFSMVSKPEQNFYNWSQVDSYIEDAYMDGGINKPYLDILLRNTGKPKLRIVCDKPEYLREYQNFREALYKMLEGQKTQITQPENLL